MTKEEREKLAIKEWHQAIREIIAESDAITDQLKQEPGYEPGLDTFSERYRAVNDKQKQRLKEIKEKYCGA